MAVPTEGRWVTINGTHILLKEGETPKEGAERKFGKDGSSAKSKGISASKGKTKGKLKKPTKEQNQNEYPELFKEAVIDKEMSQFHVDAQESILKRAGVKDITDIQSGLTGAEAEDLKWVSEGYFGNGQAMDVNSYLRGEDWGDQSAHLEKVTNHIDTAFDKYSQPLPEGIKLYRGVGLSSGERLITLKEGDVIEDSGFQSFSLDANHAYGFTRSTVHKSDKTGQTIKTNTKGEMLKGPEDIARSRVMIRAVGTGNERILYNKENQLQKEYEAVFRRGTKFKIVGKEEIIDKSTGYKIHMITVRSVPA